MVEHTSDLTAIITGLQAHTSYQIQVCAATAKGKGERASVTGTTAELGAHAPSKPNVQVLGRSAMHVSWEPPDVPLGRITRYDLNMNGKIIYSGIEMDFAVHRLVPDTDYTFVVAALTSEGKFESKPTKKRTSKDEYDVIRPPLYQPPKKEEPEEAKLPKTAPKQKLAQESYKMANTISSSGKTQGSNLDIDHPKSASSSSSIAQPHISPTGEKPKTTLKRENLRPRNQKEQSTRTSPSPPVRDLSFLHHSHTDHTVKVKSPSPVTISYVSIQDGSEGSLESPRRPSNRLPGSFDSSTHAGFRVDRSKTTLLSSKPTTRPKFSRVNTDVKLGGNVNLSTLATAFQGDSSVKQIVGDVNSVVNLPKPSLPSPMYLEGKKRANDAPLSPHLTMLHSVDINIPDFTSVINSQCQLKKLSSPPAMMSITDHVAISPETSYFLESRQAFLQRTKTFMSSHRPAAVIRAKSHYPNVPSQLEDSHTYHFVPATGSNLTQQQQKFIPVQLRTHLRPTALQRINTTLVASTGGLSRKSEPFTRSQTRIRIKSQSTNQIKATSISKT